MDPKVPVKILLVDDREDNLFSIESILEQDDYIISKANSGRQALKVLLKEQDFTLILMDVQMPDLNGFETAALIYERERLRHIPIIFITAHNHSEANIHKGYKTGAVDYIYKPINADLLKAKVAVLVELYRKNHQLLAQEQKLTAINKNLEKEIKERKLSEERVNILNKKLLDNIHSLEATNAELARFAYIASHDLQEPLRKIRAFGDRLSEKYRPQLADEGRDYIDRMQKASKRMQLLIDDILTFSKVANNQHEFVETDLNQVISEILIDLEVVIEQKKAKFFIEKLPVIQGVPGLIRQLFQNLFSNSLKFSKKDVIPEIVVSCTIDEEVDSAPGERYCRIVIQDNGIGFEDNYSDQIFGMFQRLHGIGEYEGTGIGLAICKKIIEQHNGFIKAKSAMNEGAEFSIFLPLVKHEKTKNAAGALSENTHR